MTWWQAVVLGVVQGVTEFLPVSSTAHLILVQQGFDLPADGPFTTVVQLGTLLAVFVYFRRDIGAILKGVLADAKAREFGTSTESRLAYLILLGSVPAGAAGVLFSRKIKAALYDPLSIGVAAVAFALLMLAAEIWHRTRKEDRFIPESLDHDITWREALWVGVWQAFALWPGASRSGTCMTGALFAGLSRPTAARFSFLLSLPVMLAAGAKELFDAREKLRAPTDELFTMLLATGVAAVVGYGCIAWLIAFLKKFSMTVFVAYRLALGAVLIALALLGVLKTPPAGDSRATVTAVSPPAEPPPP